MFCQRLQIAQKPNDQAQKLSHVTSAALLRWPGWPPSVVSKAKLGNMSMLVRTDRLFCWIVKVWMHQISSFSSAVTLTGTHSQQRATRAGGGSVCLPQGRCHSMGGSAATPANAGSHPSSQYSPAHGQTTAQPSLLTVIISMTWKEFHGPFVGILLFRAHVFCLPLVGHLEEAAAASIGTALVGVRYLEDSAEGESRTFRGVTSMT